MKLIKFLKGMSFSLFGIIFLLSSCTKKYADINTDRNTIATIGAAELPFLFARAQKEATPSIWNYQIAQNLFADQYAQYIANTATYFPSDRLVIRMDWVGGPPPDAPWPAGRGRGRGRRVRPRYARPGRRSRAESANPSPPLPTPA